MARMRAIDAAVRVLECEGVTTTFGVPGAAINPLYAALKARGSIAHILARHVEGAAHMAEGYTRAAAGNIGVCIGTSGPAGTDMVTGLYSAWADSIPILCITGQAPRARLHKEDFQAVDITVPARREQHALGVTMVADFFARAGWDVATSSFRGDEAVHLARRESFDVIGLSAACTGHFDEMAADIQALRQASRNRAVGIMVGGAAFTGHGDRVAYVRADATAGNALQAPLVAAQLVAAREGAS